MKINADLTKALLTTVAKTTFDRITSSPVAAAHDAPKDIRKDAVEEPSAGQTDGPAQPGQKSAEDSQLHEPFSQVLKGIGTQVTAAVTESLSCHIDHKVVAAVDAAELALERQRVAALKQMQAVLAAERTKTIDALQKSAAALSKRIVISAVLVGVSLLIVAAALILHK